MKKFSVWKNDASQEIIEGTSATVIKEKGGLKIKIGSRIIKCAVGFTEICECIKIQ